MHISVEPKSIRCGHEDADPNDGPMNAEVTRRFKIAAESGIERYQASRSRQARRVRRDRLPRIQLVDNAHDGSPGDMSINRVVP